MQFTTFDGRVIPEIWVKNYIPITVENLKEDGYVNIFLWEKEFLEWYLDRNIECENGNVGYYIKLHKDITEDELKQLEQLIDYLEL